MELILINNLTKQVYSHEVSDYFTSNVYFHFELKLEEGMMDGEYTYELMDGDCKIAEGLLQIGDYKAETKEFNNNNEKKTYKVYGKK